uniref:HIVEP zinc finger 3 n=1 Tax=Oreochromis niloticus TaxID=8128 RepID=A0A669EV79_ORENI
MEAEPSHPADGERSGRQAQQHVTSESSLGSCPPQQPQQPPNPRPVHRALGRLQNRQPKRTDLLRLQQQQAVAWQHSDTPGPSGGSFFSTSSSSTLSLPSTSSTQGEHAHGVPTHSSQHGLEGVSSPRKGEKKPQKPGKYVCTYCGRPCAKPSVLQKHIRSHTGERPYPCAPCGFSFKTKSNLYKHRKSHAHRIKAGLASSRDEPSLSGAEGSGAGEDPEEHTEGESTESEEETGQHRKSSKEMLGQHRKGGKEHLGSSEESQRPEDSHAVKQRLALRLSERKRGPMASPDDPPSSLSTSSSSIGPGSKGSTESGYFSGSGSTDICQVSPPSSSAKTYAEIILGKYGRLGGQQRSPHQQQPHPSHSSSSGTEEKNISFAVPKTQVIEHITKLITINEAVVDTSEIDSVKPRRSSLSRKSSMESPKFTAPKDPYAFDPKGEAAGPSGLRHIHNPDADPPGTQDQSAVPLLRSHSMPISTSQGEPFTSGTMSPRGYRLCQSFDEQQAVVAEMRIGHAQRMLKRQPAIEVPLGAESMLEEPSPTTSSSSTRGTEIPRQPQQQQQQQKSPAVFECGTCGARFQESEVFEAHRSICPGQEQESRDASKVCSGDRPLMMHYKFRALAMAVRKRRKEESLEEDPPSPGSVAVSGSSGGIIPVPRRPEQKQALSGVSLQTEPNQQQQQDRKGVSVIQHTSSFEKQESISMESQDPDLRESQQTQQPEPKPSPSTSRLIRQPNIQVPEILVTVEPDAEMPPVSPPLTASSAKEAERVEEFHWPQRSQTLAQLPAEKLPPKKKRLRLAEAAQSSGESSFESMSLPRSPSQESNISNFSVSFEDAAQSEQAARAPSSQSSQMLMVPSASHQHHQSHKEMRRSASEQAPASPQQTEQIPETRKSRPPISSVSSSLTQESLATISYHHPRPVIATCLAQLAPVVSLVVPVRLQTHIPTYASAMYTTLSQILVSTRSQEPVSCTAMVIMGQVERETLQRSYLKVPSPDVKSLLPLSLSSELASGSGDGYGPLGAGGSKRMLSPAASLELSTEAQRHQKRVKEEEEEEEHHKEEEEEGRVEPKVVQEEERKATGKKLEKEKKKSDTLEATSADVQGQPEEQPRKNDREEKVEEKETTEKITQKKEAVSAVEVGASASSFPSLHTSTSVNWCYQKYVKPNPSAQRDPRTSVYSTWSVSAHNPNLPGISTKVALSLLCSKQKHTSEIYTMATAPTPAEGKVTSENSRTPHVSEVHATPPSTLTEVKEQQQPEKKEENKEMREVERPSTSKPSEPSRVCIFEGGYKSNEEYVYVRGRGRGKYICGECGIRCKKPSMLKKHIRTHTDVRPYICKHCNFAFKTKGNLTKHMKSKAHGKKCQAMGVSESSLDEPDSEETAGSEERVCGSEEQEEHQFSDVEESDDDEDNDDDDDEEEEEESTSHEDPPSSVSSDTHPSTGGRSSSSRHSKQGTPDPEPPGPIPCTSQEPSPRGVWPSRRAASPGSRRAVFSRRGWKASPRAFSPSSESCSPSRSLSPRLEYSSPIHSLSPRTELPSPSRHVSPSPERGPSPIRPLSPLLPLSPSCYRSSQVPTPPSPLGMQHRTPGYLPWENPGTSGSHIKVEKSGSAGEGPTWSDTSLFPPAFRISTCEGYPGHQTTDNIFSHLPMHSQQAKVPYLMIPIGGIQIVQARPRSHATTPSSPTSPPMEGPSLARFETYWGGTPRTQGLRTPGDHWSEHQTAGTSQSGQQGLSTALTFSKPQLEVTDSKQYGSSHSSVHTHGSSTETTEHCARDDRSRAPPTLTPPVASSVIGQQPEREERPSGSDMVEGGAKGDSATGDQRT